MLLRGGKRIRSLEVGACGVRCGMPNSGWGSMDGTKSCITLLVSGHLMLMRINLTTVYNYC